MCGILLQVLLYVFVYIGFMYCYLTEVIPEQIAVTHVNDKYAEGVKAKVMRYGRRSAYYIDAEGTTKHTWSENISGYYHFKNVGMDVQEFPYKWPFEKFKVELIVKQWPTEDIIGKAYIIATIKQKVRKAPRHLLRVPPQRVQESFIELNYKGCKKYVNDPYIGPTIRRYINFMCPFPACYMTQIIPEQISLTYVNDKYVDGVKLTIKRYGRRSLYYVNVEGTTKHVWGENISLHVVFYEYLHNEFRRSFVEINYKGCKKFVNDPYLGPTIRKNLNFTCPAPAGYYHLKNLSVNIQEFPYKWPFEKCKLEGLVKQWPTEEIIGKGYIIALFKQKVVKTKA